MEMQSKILFFQHTFLMFLKRQPVDWIVALAFELDQVMPPINQMNAAKCHHELRKRRKFFMNATKNCGNRLSTS